jgi:hypothetical protein
MNSDRRLRSLVVVGGLMLLAGCEHSLTEPKDAASFGEPNRQTMLAQVIDPDPQYDTATPPSSGEHAAQAIERYRTDKVKKPERIRTTQGASGGSGN